jgi:hypothetical protein
MAAALLGAMACDEHQVKRASPDPTVAAVPRATPTDSMPEDSVVRGSADGKAFPPVAASWVIESPEVEGATVVYLFSRPVACVALSFSGWDSALEDGTAVLAIEMFGSEPGSYLASSASGPSPRAAGAVWMRSARQGASVDLRASSGWVTLNAISRLGAARGSFALTFGSASVTGTFRASFCADGHEP